MTMFIVSSQQDFFKNWTCAGWISAQVMFDLFLSLSEICKRDSRYENVGSSTVIPYWYTTVRPLSSARGTVRTVRSKKGTKVCMNVPESDHFVHLESFVSVFSRIISLMKAAMSFFILFQSWKLCKIEFQSLKILFKIREKTNLQSILQIFAHLNRLDASTSTSMDGQHQLT